MLDYWRNQGYTAPSYQQEQFENAAQVQTAALCDTAAQMNFRFSDIENNVEANFSQQQQGFLSEKTSESAQALEVQRHSLIHEAVAEMLRRDTHKEEVLSQLRSDLQHAQGQSE